MSNLHWSLLNLYLSAAVGYGGWRGRDLWSDGGVWCLLLPPFAWECIGLRRLEPDSAPVKFRLAVAILNIAGIGGFALLFTSWFASLSSKWSEEPGVRAAASASAAVGVFVLSAYGTGKRAEARAAKDSGKSPDSGA